jgi:hypothetical protein
MKYRQRIYYTETDKALMWDRWQKGESLNSIESPRVYRRLHFLRGWSYEQVYKVFAGSPRTGSPVGV